MVPIVSLVLPILVAAVLVFLASSVMHMVLTYHRSDFRKLPAEADIQEALRKFNIPPGDYMLPCGGSPDAMKRPEFVEAMTRGPVAIMTVLPSGPPSMGASLALWFVYCCIVGVFAAYIAGRALPADASYLAVFRFAGATAFAGYFLAQLQVSIWYKRSWTTTFKNGVDSLIYAGLTGGAFGWLWPR